MRPRGFFFASGMVSMWSYIKGVAHHEYRALGHKPINMNSIECGRCNGTGMRREDYINDYGSDAPNSEYLPCNECNGTGRVEGQAFISPFDVKNTPVTFTNGIPICPYCGKGTQRTRLISTVTVMAWIPKYNEEGISLNPDPNTRKIIYECHTCYNYYGVATRMNVSEYYECKQP